MFPIEHNTRTQPQRRDPLGISRLGPSQRWRVSCALHDNIVPHEKRATPVEFSDLPETSDDRKHDPTIPKNAEK